MGCSQSLHHRFSLCDWNEWNAYCEPLRSLQTLRPGLVTLSRPLQTTFSYPLLTRLPNHLLTLFSVVSLFLLHKHRTRLWYLQALQPLLNHTHSALPFLRRDMVPKATAGRPNSRLFATKEGQKPVGIWMPVTPVAVPEGTVRPSLRFWLVRRVFKRN